MGSIVLQVNGTTVGNVADVAGIEIVRSVSEQDSGRLLTALGDYYASHFNEEYPKTIEHIIETWWNDVIRQAMKHVERHEAKALKPPAIQIIEA
jgi:hypothetical protein